MIQEYVVITRKKRTARGWKRSSGRSGRQAQVLGLGSAGERLHETLEHPTS